MKATEIRELGEGEIQTKLGELKETLFNLRFQHETGQLENPEKNRADQERDCSSENRLERKTETHNRRLRCGHENTRNKKTTHRYRGQ